MGNACSCIDSNKVNDFDEDLYQPLLHGILKIHVIEAKDLPDTDNTFYNIARGDLTDPYVEVSIGKTSLLKTAVVVNSLNPTWDEKFVIPVCHNASKILVKVKDREHIGHNSVGYFSIPIDKLLSEEPVCDWFDVIVGNNGETEGSVHIWIQYSMLPNSQDNAKMVQEIYFQPQVNNRVTMYQDADTPQLDVFEGITWPDGSPYSPPRCWIDLYQAIREATTFIYITGWSVFTGISLLRGEDRVNNPESNIGELLKAKAKEGVRVLVMIWNEKSNDTGLMAGIMGTHDEETFEYFDGTEVKCANVPRQKESWLGLGGQFVSTFYTHHQKSVICDAPPHPDSPSQQRRILAFVGGLDITDGRFDTPEFPLFKTLHTCHAGDFYSNCVPGVSPESGPRQPWHDIHAKVEGPGAVDVCHNFMERWRKQCPQYEAYLLDLAKDFNLELEGPYQDHEGGPWVTQVFRSITSDSATFSPTRVDFLHKKYGRRIDNSIEKAYINAIRNAHNYIYIENQYFLGSAFSWFKDRGVDLHHLIPRELTEKIINKIKKNEEFKVYICIPMYPEGDPSSDTSQEILHWQYRTMQFMYKRIGRALADLQMADRHPTDYLNFFCLGKRESPEDVPDGLPVPEGNLPNKVRKSLRHPIYVHSKLMIVDDDYFIIGSANINQRSIGGNRDTEICIGGYQPSHTVETNNARGYIHTFRLALWSAHLGGYNTAIDNPNSDECFKYVRQTTDDFWALYTAKTPQHSKVHLLPYPIRVTREGDVNSLSKPWDKFPDTNAPVIGQKTNYLLNKLTT